MSVARLVSHVLMWPYVLAAAAASLHHAVTAVRRVAVLNTNGVGANVAVGACVGTGVVVGASVVVGTGVGSGVGTPVGAHVGEWEPPLPSNIPSVLTPVRSQHSTWLNEEAPSNIRSMLVTWLVSNEDKSPLNEEAPANISSMFVTRLVSNEDKS